MTAFLICVGAVILIKLAGMAGRAMAGAAYRSVWEEFNDYQKAKQARNRSPLTPVIEAWIGDRRQVQGATVIPFRARRPSCRVTQSPRKKPYTRPSTVFL